MSFTARITTPNGVTTRSNCTLINGILCGSQREGVGKGIEKGGFTAGGDGDTWIEYKSYKTVYFPYTNADVISKDFEMTEAQWKDYMKSLTEGAFSTDPKVIEAGIKMGQNPYGRFVEDLDAIKEREKAEKQKSISEKSTPIEFSQRCGLRIITRLPPDVWAIVKSYASFQKWDEDDEDVYGFGVTKQDVEGWVYQDEVIATLTKKGFACHYSSQVITCRADMEAISKKAKEEINAYKKLVKEVKATDETWRKIFSELKTAESYDLCTQSYETDNARQLPNINVGSWKGATIYGGGKWFNIIGNDLYLVFNNGHDGDDWGRNNYVTGGAGAIGYKVTGGATLFNEYKAWVESLGELATVLN